MNALKLVPVIPTEENAEDIYSLRDTMEAARTREWCEERGLDPDA